MTARSTAMAVAVALACGGCKPDNELPRTYINGPQVLAIKADPPSVPPGGSSTISTLIAGTGGETPSVSWVRCRRAPRPGEAINPDCVDTAQADYLEPIGDGTTITTTMPDDVTAAVGVLIRETGHDPANTVVLVKASRAAGLERVAAALLGPGENAG